jgi:hypothetical protein
MNSSDDWIKDELLQLFYSTAVDFRAGIIDEETFKEKLLKLAERYERNFVEKEKAANQKDLF